MCYSCGSKYFLFLAKNARKRPDIPFKGLVTVGTYLIYYPKS